jgi:hypothetical protein
MQNLSPRLLSLFLFALPKAATASDVDAGFDALAAARVMTNKSSHSWEWGAAAEALLELYNPELSVFGSNPFPSGKIPQASSNTTALVYAKQFINTQSLSGALIDDSSIGGPASLGVSAILLGRSDSVYTSAANSQADVLLKTASHWSNGAISQTADVAEVWAENMAMSLPFCTSFPLDCFTRLKA